MVKTIFYFKDTLPFEEYYEKWTNGEIADHTIVFVDDTKAIFKGGKQFGSTSDPDMTEKIISLIQENKYVLPTASSLVLGGIKVGEYLQIDDNGTLSVNPSSLPLSNVSALSYLNTGTRVATVTVNGLSTDIYAPGQAEIEEIINSHTDPYDDSELRDWLDNLDDKIDLAKQTLLDQIDALNSSLESLRSTANGIRSDLNSVINDLDNTIKTRVQQLFDDEEWVRNNFPDGAGSTSNFGEEDVQAYLQRIGLWEDSDNYTLTKWSTLYQDVNTLKFDVSLIITKNNGEYTISELFQSIINAYIDEQVSGIEAGAMYARTDDLENVLEWLYSGLKAQSSPDLTYAQLISAAKNNELGTSAIAELRTQIQDLDGRYVAQSSLSTAVNDSLATLIQSVSDYSSLTLIINTIDANAENIAGLTTSVERLEGGGTISKVELLASVKDEVENDTLNSGIRTEVDSRAGTVTNSIVGDIIDAQTGKVTAASLISSIINDNASKTQLTNFVTGVVNTNDNGETLDEIVESYVNTIMEASLLGSGWTTWTEMVQGTISGLSALESRVGTLENGDWVTTANLGSKISDIDKGTDAWAGLVTTTKLSNDIASAKSEMTSSAQSAIDTAIGGVYTKAQTDSAISSASAALESSVSGTYVKKASVITEVNNNTSNVKINADKIDIQGLLTAYDAQITNLITEYISGGLATFKGYVEATSFIAGDSNGVNVTTSSDRVSFNVGGDPKAYFVQDSDGFLLYIYHDNDWYSINFDNWNSTNNPSLPSKSITLYKFEIGSSSEVETKTIFYNNLNKCFVDYNGDTIASDSNTSGYYVSLDTDAGFLVDSVEYLPHQPATGLHEIYPVMMYNGYVVKDSWPKSVYCPVSFNSNGKMIIDTDINHVILRIENDIVTLEAHVCYLTASSTQVVGAGDIYLGKPTLGYKLTDHADQREQTYDSSYQLYVATLSTTPVTLNHVSTIGTINNHWTASNY